MGLKLIKTADKEELRDEIAMIIYAYCNGTRISWSHKELLPLELANQIVKVTEEYEEMYENT